MGEDARRTAAETAALLTVGETVQITLAKHQWTNQ
jgi:hypothetical protein